MPCFSSQKLCSRGERECMTGWPMTPAIRKRSGSDIGLIAPVLGLWPDPNQKLAGFKTVLVKDALIYLKTELFSKSRNLFLTCSANRNISTPIPCRQEGRFAIVSNRGAGCDGRGKRQAVYLAGRSACSVRRSRVVLAPRPWRLSIPACAGVATVTTNAAHRGEHV